MSSRHLREAVGQAAVSSVTFFVVRIALGMIPGRTPEPLSITVLTSLVFGIAWAAVSWGVRVVKERKADKEAWPGASP